MKRVRLSQGGVAHLLLALFVVIVLGVVGYGAYYVSQKDNKTAKTVSQNEDAQDAPQKLESNNDFEQAAQTLDADENDTSLDPAQLDADLNSLL
jgi:uncharacterized protein HemX